MFLVYSYYTSLISPDHKLMQLQLCIYIRMQHNVLQHKLHTAHFKSCARVFQHMQLADFVLRMERIHFCQYVFPVNLPNFSTTKISLHTKINFSMTLKNVSLLDPLVVQLRHSDQLRSKLLLYTEYLTTILKKKDQPITMESHLPILQQEARCLQKFVTS